MKEPLRATSFMAGSGGGWIVNGRVVMDRFLSLISRRLPQGPERIRV
jgi:hypothetical protein